MLDEKRGATRRRWTGALVTAAVAAALLVIPLPYGRTVGYDVSIRISGATRPGAVKAAASTWRRQSGATAINVSAQDLGTSFILLDSHVPLRSRRQLDQLVAAFSDGLRERGMQVQVEVEPRREQVSGSVFAMARDKVPELRLDTTQSAEALTASIRTQLDEVGLPDADVEVHKDGDETQVEINAQAGEPGGPRVAKQLRFKVRGDGEARAPLGGPPVERTPGMTDEQYRDAIVEKLRADGIEDAEVTVSGGRVEVRARREGP